MSTDVSSALVRAAEHLEHMRRLAVFVASRPQPGQVEVRGDAHGDRAGGAHRRSRDDACDRQKEQLTDQQFHRTSVLDRFAALRPAATQTAQETLTW